MPRDLHKRAADVRPSAARASAGGAARTASYIPYFCWHPELSVAGNCRICCVQVEGRSWVRDRLQHAGRPKGLRVLTDSDAVKAYRKSIMQLMTLNHPVDCGICDKAGECTLQDYHYAYNGAPSRLARSRKCARPSSTRSPSASCSTTSAASCARAACASRARSRSRTRSASSQRGDHSLVRAAEDRPLDADPYSDNVIDLCPVGRAALALLPVQGARLVPRSRRLPSARAARAAARSRSGIARRNGSSTRSTRRTERPHRARDAARKSGSQRTLDLQQGARSCADLRAAARDAGDA